MKKKFRVTVFVEDKDFLVTAKNQTEAKKIAYERMNKRKPKIRKDLTLVMY